jgi:hypothetical protein
VLVNSYTSLYFPAIQNTLLMKHYLPHMQGTVWTLTVLVDIFVDGKVRPHPLLGKVKVKVTLVQALRLCTGRTAHSGSRGIALLYRH